MKRLYDSTKTRVIPLFDFFSGDITKINKLLSLLSEPNKVLLSDNNLIIRYGTNEMTIPPTKKLLNWCIENLPLLMIPKNYGVKRNSETYNKRDSLFKGDTNSKSKAFTLLHQNKSPKRDWYIFEGYTHPDIYIETEDTIIVGEAKRIEPKLTTSTEWLKKRDQLIRHVDAIIDSGKKVYSFLIISENKINTYNLSAYNDLSYYKESLRHRNDMEIEKIKSTYLGYTTWDEIQKAFGVNFPKTVLDCQ